VKFPSPSDDAAADAWNEFFAANQPTPLQVTMEISKLHETGRHKQVIAAVQGAIVNGQAQPWMYEVLALSMEIEKYPKDDVERVVLSMTDFGSVEYGSMLYSAAYLVRFGRLETALRLFRQASRLQPDQPEPYLLAFEHAQRLQSNDDIIWAACGILQNDWTRQHAKDHQNAEDAIKTLEKEFTKAGKTDELNAMRALVAEAKQRDVLVELSWNGNGDLDLEVEEPLGTVCSFSQPQTQAGGYHLHDGFGPKPEDCHETYVCPSGQSGEYRIKVKLAWGQIVGNRATLKITTHRGTPQEKVETKTLKIEEGQATATVKLEQGRRRQPRVVEDFAEARAARMAENRRPSRKAPNRDANVRRAAAQAEFTQGNKKRVGAVGYQPVISVIPEGAQLGAQALVSPDRRYVRIGVAPMFSNITDVFTFSAVGGNTQGNGAAGGNGGAGGGNNGAGVNR
jgi:hypothetical protein